MAKSETYPYCEHNRMGDACEDCAYQKAKDAGVPLGGPPPAETRTANEKARLEAEKTGEGSATMTAATSTRSTSRK